MQQAWVNLAKKFANMYTEFKKGIKMVDAKRTPSYSLDLHFLVIKYIYRSDLPKSEIYNIGGVQYVQKNKGDGNRPEDCQH